MTFKTFLHDYSIHSAILLLFIWLLRPRKSILGEELTSDVVCLKTHTGMRVLAGFVGILGLFFLLISAALYANPDGIEWGTAIPCTLFSLGILYWVVKVFTFRIEANSQGLRYSAAAKNVLAQWSELKSITWKERRVCHVIDTQNGSFPVSAHLEGAILLFKMIQKHRPDLISIGYADSISPQSTGLS